MPRPWLRDNILCRLGLRKIKFPSEFEADATVGNRLRLPSAAGLPGIYAATPAGQLVEADKPKEVGGLSVTEMSRMEHELESLSQDFKLIEDTHGRNVLNLVLVVSYLKKLLDNAGVVRYLSRSYPEILTEFQKVTESKSLANGE